MKRFGITLFALFGLVLPVSAKGQCVASSPLATANDSSIVVGTTTQATLKYTVKGQKSTNTCVVTWRSSDTTRASVSAGGVVTAKATGTVTITGTVAGVSDGIPFTILAAPTPTVTVTGITLTPITVSLDTGTSQQFTTTLLYSDGHSAQGVATYSATGGSISSAGLYTAGSSAGSFVVISVAAGFTDTAAVTVTVPATVDTTTPPPPSSGTAPTPGATSVILWSDTVTSTSLSRYAKAGVQQVVSNGAGGYFLRFPYTSNSYDNLIEFNFSSAQDLYVSFRYRTSVGADPVCGDGTGSGIKWFMPWRSSDPRVTNGVGLLNSDKSSSGPLYTWNAGLDFSTHDNSSPDQPNPFLQSLTKTPRFGTTNDGNWHTYTVHLNTIKATVNGGNGFSKIWVDGVFVLDDEPYGYHRSTQGFSLIQLPGTKVMWGSACGTGFNIDIDNLVVWHN